MSSLPSWDEIPDCCKECKRFDSEYSDISMRYFYCCEKNVFFPTKKQTCKKQEKYNGGGK